MASHDPQFGVLIACRKTSRSVWISVAILVMLTGLFLVLAFPIVTGSSPGPLGGSSPWPDRLLVLAVPAILTVALIAVVYSHADKVVFYENGVVRHRFGRTLARIPYEDCVAHQLRQVDRRTRGIYVGTNWTLSLRSFDGRGIRFHAVSRLEISPSGTVLRPRLSTTESNLVEKVAHHIAAIMARQWLDRLHAGESIEWTTFATLAPNGVASWDGATKGTMALYAELDPVEIRSRCGDVKLSTGRQFLSIPTGDPNFYPGMVAANAMIDLFNAG